MTEHDFQCNIVKTLRMQNIFCFEVPNSQHLLTTNNQFLRMKFLAKLKREGMLTGASDLIIIHKGKVYFVEIKAPVEYKRSEKTGKTIIAKSAGKQSTEQIKFQKEVESEDLPYVLIDSWKKFEDFLAILKKNESVNFVRKFGER
jgi:hypothetical protein